MTTSERLRLARELHDGIAQDLVGLGYSLDLLLAHETLDAPSRASIRTSRLHVDELMAKVRREILNLRSAAEQSFAASLKVYVQREFSDYALELDISEVDLSEDQGSELFRAVEEMLRNIRAHARATHIAIKLFSLNNRSYLEVSDNGIGGAALKDNHHGLSGITERIQAIGGSVEIENINASSTSKSGVRFTVIV
jgi:NarL family two-component system sensor histidine kinase LiaS